MKNTSISIIALLGCIAVMSVCTGKSKSSESLTISVENNDKVPIYVNMEGILKKEGTEQLSTTATEITYIPLELTDNSTLRGISFFVHLNGKLIVSDSHSIILFDKDGKYIKDVSQSGQGPSDFVQLISHIIVDNEESNLYLFSSHNKVIQFNKNADYIRNFQINNGTNWSITKGTFTPQNTMILAYHNVPKRHSDTTTVYNAIEVDTIGNILNKFENYSPRYIEENGIRYLNSIPFLDVFNNNIRFMDFSNDTIFTIIDNAMIPYAILDLGEDKTTFTLDYYLSENFNQSKLNEAYDKLKGHAIMDVQENDNYLFFKLTKKGLRGDGIYSIYNKQTKDLKLLKNEGLLNDLDGGPDFFPRKCIGDIMVGWKKPTEFKEEVLSKDYNEQKAKYGERFEKVYQLAKSLQEDDNPILMVVKK
jgi:hypothetical protein